MNAEVVLTAQYEADVAYCIHIRIFEKSMSCDSDEYRHFAELQANARRMFEEWVKSSGRKSAGAEASERTKKLNAQIPLNTPVCPVCKTAMTWVENPGNEHDIKEPHWRCETWIGSGVCGQYRFQFKPA